MSGNSTVMSNGGPCVMLHERNVLTGALSWYGTFKSEREARLCYGEAEGGYEVVFTKGRTWIEHEPIS